MKIIKIILILLLVLTKCIDAEAQPQPQLWGTTYVGGSHGKGTIFRVNEDGTNFTVLYSFDTVSGSGPVGNLYKTNNGILYGNGGGGSMNYGVIFSFDPSNNIYHQIHNFDSIQGINPQLGIIESNNHIFYGTTYRGGSHDIGTIFSIDPSNSSFADLFDFNYHCGVDTLTGIPQGGVIIINNKLYGTTQAGALYCTGVIYSFDLTTQTLTYLHSFNLNSTDGHQAMGNLLYTNNGKLYGTSSTGGSNGLGVIYCIDTLGNNYNVIHNFSLTTGGVPGYSGLIKSNNGKLYGVAEIGGTHHAGVIYSIDSLTNNYSVVYNFDSLTGAEPLGSIMQGANGKLYGIATYGGLHNYGTIFSYDLTSNVYTDLFDFDSVSTGKPWNNGLIEIGRSAGIENITSNNSFSIFPNPACTSITLHNHLPSFNRKLIITDVIRNIVHEQSLSNITESTIDVSKWSNGVYFYEVNSEKECVRGKFIVEK